jgi:thiamine transporter
MLYQVIFDGDEISYVPTALGNALLILIFIALLAAAVFFARKRSAGNGSRKLTVKQLVFCAVSIALATALSNIKLFDAPMGGSVTLLSMLIVCLPGYWFGLEAGLMTGIAHGILQMVMDPYIIHPAQLMVDYLLAFGALGLSGLFSNAKSGLLKGYATAVTGRWIFASISGWIFFSEYTWEGWHPIPYSLAYNGSYIFIEAGITLILLTIPAVKNAFSRIKKLALEQ